MNKYLSRIKSHVRNSPLRGVVQNFRHRGLRESDVFLASYPKSGNTWLRHLLTYVVTGEPTKWRGQLSDVSIIVGRHHRLSQSLRDGGRLIKTHEPFRPEYRRSVFLVRDGRDVAVSEFHYQKQYSSSFCEYDDDFSKFFARFLDGTVNGYGAWHAHTISWLNSPANERGDLLVIKFDDLKASTLEQLQRVAEFLQLDADSDRLDGAIANSTVEAMKQKERDYWRERGMENPNFVRTGKSGNWQELLSDQEIGRFKKVAGEAMKLAGYEL